MYQFKNEFRELRCSDGYDGCLRLPNGDKPIICQVATDTDSVDVILSGSGLDTEVIITLVHDGIEYILVLPEYSMVPIIVIDTMVNFLDENIENLYSAVEEIISDLNMTRVDLL